MEINNYLEKSQAKAEFVGKNGNVRRYICYICAYCVSEEIS